MSPCRLGAWGASSSALNVTVDPAVDFEGAKRSQRNQVLATQEVADDTKQRLRNAIMISQQSEQLGTETLADLHDQRAKLEAVGEDLYVIDENMGKSRRILAGMARRALTSKIVLVIIIILLLGAIGLVLYLRWGR